MIVEYVYAAPAAPWWIEEYASEAQEVWWVEIEVEEELPWVAEEL